MSYNQLQEHLKDNPEFERYYGAPVNKNPLHFTDTRHAFEKSGPAPRFNEKLKAISKAHPKNKMNVW